MVLAEHYKYNPSQLDEADLEATFVGRDALLAGLLDDLRKGARASSNQHYLIAGARGLGKTTMLLMLRKRVREDKKLAKAYRPIATAEEEYSITTLRDFFDRIVELLLEEGQDAHLSEAQERAAQLANDDDAAEHLIDALRKWSERNDRKLLLLVDNLDLIFGDQVKDDAQIGRLRDLLMNESFIVLVGASPTYFQEVQGYERPFYQFFKLIVLEELTADQMAELLQRCARREENEDMLQRFDEIRPRLKAIHHLTGGNPRLALMLYQFYTRNELPEVRTTLQALLDDVTPYYKSILEKLAPQQRKVMDTFARLGHPATPTELAKETRLPVNQVNSILQRLRETGFVSVPRQQRRKRTLYMVSERFFRIWHQMRCSGAGRKKLEFLIDFIRILYSPREWRSEAERLLAEYQSCAGAGRFAEAGRFVEHIAYLVEAAPKLEWGDEVGGKAIKACIDSEDFNRAEELIRDRIRDQTARGDSKRLARAWFHMSKLRRAQTNVDEEIVALERAVQHDSDFYVAQLALAAGFVSSSGDKSGAAALEAMDKACEQLRVSHAIRPDEEVPRTVLAGALLSRACHAPPELAERFLDEAASHLGAIEELTEAHPVLLSGWGWAHTRLADYRQGTERERMLQNAVRKFKASQQLEPVECAFLIAWAEALFKLALQRGLPEGADLMEQSCAKCEAAARVARDDPVLHVNWSQGLFALSGAKSGSERNRLLEASHEKAEIAVRLAESGEHPEIVAWCSEMLLLPTLSIAVSAIRSADFGRARSAFAAALDCLRHAKRDEAFSHFAFFFQSVTTEDTFSLAGELLEAMRDRVEGRDLGPLEPFAKAVQYWQADEADRAEILDRLNPEEREAVEKILQRKEIESPQVAAES